MRTTQIRWLLRVIGAGLLVATGAIHLDLYLTGYNTIPTIGWLFLVQVIIIFALALAILAAPLVMGSRPLLDAGLSAAGAGFSLATLGGYLLSLWVGLFGFREIRTTAGVVAGIIEIAAFAVLAALAVLTADGALAGLPASRRPQAAAAESRIANLRRAAWAAVGAATVAAFAVLGGSLATANTGSAVPVSGGSVELRTATIDGVLGAHQRERADTLLVRPGHAQPLRLLRHLRRLLAAGDRLADRRAGRHAQQDRHDRPHGRHHPGHLRRPPAVHLHR